LHAEKSFSVRAKSLLYVIGHDIRIGFAQNTGKFVMATFFYLALAAMFIMESQSYRGFESDPAVSLLDFLIYFNKGMEVYVFQSGEQFKIPYFWIMQTVLIALLVGSYPLEDLSAHAVNILTRSKSRWLWWLSKSLWIMTTVFAFYGIGLLVALGFSLVLGSPFRWPDSEIMLLVCNIDVTRLDIVTVVALLALAPAVSCALSLVQALLSLFIGSIASFAVLMCYVLASIYFFTPFLIADYSMLQRNALFYSGGIETVAAFFVAGAIILIVLIGGFMRIKGMDILDESL
jgi:hypothetical protein